MISLYSFVYTYLLTCKNAPNAPMSENDRVRGDRGQTTAEYALVLIGAAAIALLLIAWASKTDRIGRLFDFALDHITGRAA